MGSVLEMRNISKTFGEVAALHDVQFQVGDNESVGLLGDNGAGKSTLVKIITGYHRPDPGGEILWKGTPLSHLSVARAHEIGIEVVPGSDACAECLVPPELMRSIVDNELGGTPYRVGSITLPEKT